MKILGVSGLAEMQDFKRRHWPGLDEREYRIAQGFDSAAAIVVDGQIVACVAEERLVRRKHTGEFPTEAIRYCLDEAGLELEDIDELVHSFDYGPYRAAFSLDPVSSELYRDVLSQDALLEVVARELPGFPPDRVRRVNHHLAHAASAYSTSGWDDCLVVRSEEGRVGEEGRAGGRRCVVDS